MKRWLEIQAYRLCWFPGRMSSWWARIFYRYYCPYPTTDNYRARACVEAGLCGCDNEARYSKTIG